MKHLVWLLFLPLFAAGQNGPDSTISTSILHKFENYTVTHPSESVYLHFDKPYYAAGDTMYFKAYVTLSHIHQLSALSGVLHAEFIDNISGKILLSEKLPVVSGVAWGDFAIPDSLHNKSYRIRAYTRLMLNKQSLFEQNIQVVPVTKGPAKIYPAFAGQKSDIQFFPEGGSFVDGIDCKIAFKAIAQNGLGIGASGEIFDNENNVVATFKTAHLGMGYFSLKPKASKTYFAKVHFADGTETNVEIPKADDSGITLSVNNAYSSTVAQVKITANKNSFMMNKGQAYILSVYTNGQLTNIGCRLDTNVVMINLYKWKLHSGITKLTLFSPTGEPLNERLLFIQNNDELKLNVSTDKPLYSSGEKVSIKLLANDKKEMPVPGNFSVSVINENKAPVDTNSESTILNNMLLTADLKGNIEQPNYYFARNAAAQNDLDILLLTQGYRGFEWKQVMADTTTREKFQAEPSLEISGNIKTTGGKTVSQNDVNLVSTNPYIAKDTITDNKGNFAFHNINVIDTAKLLLRVKGNRTINISQPYMPPVAKIAIADSANNQIAPEIVAEMIKQYQQQGTMKKGVLLKQVNIHAARGEHPFAPKLEHSSNLNGPGEADATILVDDYPGFTNIGDILTMIHAPGHPVAKKPKVVIINGVATPINHIPPPLESIAVDDVYSIEILNSPRYLGAYGSEATGGAIVITLRNGSESRPMSVQPGLTIYKYMGFYKAHTFYSPKYDVKPTNPLPDYRTTVYWNPVLLTDKNGNATFDFYNPDVPGNYRVVIEGIDGNGDIGRQVYNYTVK